jgi:TPR repeat protein
VKALVRFASVAAIGVTLAVFGDSLDDAQSALDAKNYPAAIALLTPLAEAGDALAQTQLAYLTFNGRGVERDAAVAAQWYRRAAEQGDANAQYNLGVLYENGDGVPRDLAAAADWWRAAARQGNPEAQYNLGALYYNGRGVPKDLVRAYVWKSLALDGSLTTVTPRKARVGRDVVAAGLSRAQLAQAQADLATCRANLDGCD